ncbi:hypothetical protein IWQ56_004956, partial [Coemansia nantahalensis]
MELAGRARTRLAGVLSGRSGGLAIAVRVALAATTVASAVVSSILLYGVFYRLYVPQLLHEAPVYLQYAAWPGANATAVVDFVPASDYKFLSTSQAYSVVLDLDVPTSDVNEQIGNFMVAVEMRSRQGAVMHQSARPSIVPYQSRVVRLMRTAVHAVPLALGLSRESLRLHVPLIDDMYDKRQSPITHAHISLSRPLQVYSTRITVRAQFTGLRYWMYHWSVPAALVFVSFGAVWQLVVSAIAWAIIESHTRQNPLTPARHALTSSEDPAPEDGSGAALRKIAFSPRHLSGGFLAAPIARALNLADPPPQQVPRQGGGDDDDDDELSSEPEEQNVPDIPGGDSSDTSDA